MSDILVALDEVLAMRKRNADPSSSYVAGLHHKGLNKILEKIGEEATEVILAAKDSSTGDTRELVNETADLWFHTLIMLSHFGADHRAVLAELQRRFNISGIAEKASRNSTS